MIVHPGDLPGVLQLQTSPQASSDAQDGWNRADRNRCSFTWNVDTARDYQPQAYPCKWSGSINHFAASARTKIATATWMHVLIPERHSTARARDLRRLNRAPSRFDQLVMPSTADRPTYRHCAATQEW
jgi:hypothetical protein